MIEFWKLKNEFNFRGALSQLFFKLQEIIQLTLYFFFFFLIGIT